MKRIELIEKFCVLFLLVICFFSSATVSAATGLNDDFKKVRIHVTDSVTGCLVEDAYAVTENETFVCNAAGIIEIKIGQNVAAGRILLKCLGYEPVLLNCKDFLKERDKHVRLKPASHVLKEVVVRGASTVLPLNKIGEKVSVRTFDESVGTSLTAMLEKVNGVSSIRTGTTVSKPVIQGMSGHRILLVNNGAKIIGQQWGADHAPEVDMNSCNDILVIKGSDAVQYGSDALGGIVVMNPSPLPYGGRTLAGKTMFSFGTNGRKGMFSSTLEGALPFVKDVAWRLQGTCSSGGDRSTARYVLNNTGTRAYHVFAMLGYRHDKLALEGSYSRYFDKIGVMQSAQMGSEDMLKERIELGRPVYVEPFSRSIDFPFQKVLHQTGIVRVKYAAGRFGNLNWQGTWQQNGREEYSNRRLDAFMPTVSLHLTSIQNKLQWTMPRDCWNFGLGGSASYIENHSRAGTGVVPVIPNYTETQTGVYGLVKFSKANVGVEGGVRFDSQHTNAKGYDWTGKLYGGKKKFHNATYSLGGHWRCNKRCKLTSNFGVAWRAPHVFELYSNGNDLASGIFVKGDSLMNSERSYKWVTSVAYRHKLIDVKIDGFVQWIDGYIYDEPTKEMITVISGAYPVFRYKQTPAFFRGLEVSAGVDLPAHLNYRLTGAYIAAEERHSGNYLPYIPSFRFRHELGLKKNWRKTDFSATLIHRYVAKQKRFNSDTDLITYTPPAYHLFDLHAQLVLGLSKGSKLKLIASAENIFNKEYKEYTNRSRYYAHDAGRDLRAAVIWMF